MSLNNAIARCFQKNRKPIGTGASRMAFYSPTHDVVIKVEHDNWGAQSEKESKIFEEMDSKYREIFPIVCVKQFKGKHVIVMKRVEPAYIASSKKIRIYLCNLNTIHEANAFFELKNSEYDNLLAEFIKKYGICDLHSENYGIYNGHLAILDAGLMRS